MYELTEGLTQPVGDAKNCNASEHGGLSADELLRAKTKASQKIANSERTKARVGKRSSDMVQKSQNQHARLPPVSEVRRKLGKSRKGARREGE